MLKNQKHKKQETILSTDGEVVKFSFLIRDHNHTQATTRNIQSICPCVYVSVCRVGNGGHTLAFLDQPPPLL